MFELRPTEQDYADKGWLGREEDAFQLIPPDVAGYLLLAAVLLLIVLERAGLL